MVERIKYQMMNYQDRFGLHFTLAEGFIYETFQEDSSTSSPSFHLTLRDIKEDIGPICSFTTEDLRRRIEVATNQRVCPTKVGHDISNFFFKSFSEDGRPGTGFFHELSPDVPLMSFFPVKTQSAAYKLQELEVRNYIFGNFRTLELKSPMTVLYTTNKATGLGGFKKCPTPSKA